MEGLTEAAVGASVCRVAGGQAQGILSGADFTACRGSRPFIFFHPVHPILRAFSLELMTMNAT